MDLLDQLRSLRDNDAAALPAPPTFDLGNTPTFLSGFPDHSALLTHAMDLIASSSDENLLVAYERTTGSENDPEAAALLAEIHHRRLDL